MRLNISILDLKINKIFCDLNLYKREKVRLDNLSLISFKLPFDNQRLIQIFICKIILINTDEILI